MKKQFTFFSRFFLVMAIMFGGLAIGMASKGFWHWAILDALLVPLYVFLYKMNKKEAERLGE